MPINPYYRPQLTIRQQLEIAAAAGVPRMASCVIGPSYLLNRYGKESTPGVAHASGGQTLAFQYKDSNGATQALPAGHVVDQPFVDLWAEDLRSELASFAAADAKVALEDVTKPNIIQIFASFTFTTDFGSDANEVAAAGHNLSDGQRVRVFSTGTLPAPLDGDTVYYVVNSGAGTVELALTKGGTPVTLTSDGTGTHKIAAFSNSNGFAGTKRDAAFQGRDTVVGDYVRINDGSQVRERRVAALLGARTEASFGTNTAANDENGANGAYNPITDATADAAVDMLKPAGSTVTIVQTNVNFNVRGSSVISRKVAEEFTITCTSGGTYATATFAITSKSGIYSATDVSGSDGGSGAILINDAELAGATFQIDTPTTVTTGQVWKFRVYQAYTRLTEATHFTFGGTYTGPKDTTYIVEITKGTTGDTAELAECKIYDTENMDTVLEDVVINEDTAEAVGAYGLTITFNIDPGGITQEGLRKGDIYYVNCKAASVSTVNFDRILLDGPAVDPATWVDAGVFFTTASLHLYFSGKVEPEDAQVGSAWTSDTNGVAVTAGLSRNIPARTGEPWVAYEDAVGTLHASWRAVVPVTTADGLTGVDDDIENAAANGAITIDNDLAFGVSEAIRGAQGQRVYFVNTGGTSAAHFNAAFKKIEATDIVWALAILSDDESVRLAAETHVVSMSSPEKKNFRKMYVGVDSPGPYVLLNTQSDLSPYTATITDNGGENTLLTLQDPADGIDFDSVDFTAGDTIRLTSSGAEYEIAQKLSPTELELVSGPAVPASPAVPFTIWAADTATNAVKYLTTRANALDHRRATLVWYEDGTRTLDGSPTVIPAKFAACEIAGLRSALPPQAGLTRTEVTAITSAPTMYNKYSVDELDAIASEGVMIVTQSAENGSIFIRHQLTTEADNGLLYYEDNVSMIVDYLSFLFKDAFDDLIGKVNVTDDTIGDIYGRCVTILDSAKQAPVGSLYGATIVDYNGLSVARDANLRDRINVAVNISVPIPMNTLDVTVNAYIDLPAVQTTTPDPIPQLGG